MKNMEETTSEKIIKGNFYNFIQIYANFILNILSTFLIARLLTQDIWGTLILALATTAVIQIIIAYFPPAKDLILNQYIPRYYYKEDFEKLRSLLLSSYFIQFFVAFLCWIGFLLYLSYISNQTLFYQLSIILSPLIILETINSFCSNCLKGFYKFGINTGGIIARIIILLILYFLIFLFNLENPVIFIALANVISYLIPIMGQIIYIFKIIPRKNSKDYLFNLKNLFIISKDFGLYFQVSTSIATIIGYANQSILYNYGQPSYLTYLKICSNTSYFAVQAAGTLGTPILSIFSELSIKNEYEKIERSFHKIIKINGIILCIVSGILFFFIDIYLLIIYTESYFSIIIFIRIFLLEGYAHLVFSNLNALMVSLIKPKVLFIRDIFTNLYRLIFYFISIYFFDFFGYIVFIVIAIHLDVLINLFIIRKEQYSRIKISLWHLSKMLILFFISIFSSLLIQIFIFSFIDINNNLMDDFLFRIFKDLIGFIFFILIFYSIIYLTKTFTKEEIDNLFNRELFSKYLKGKNKRLSNILMRFLPSEKKEKKRRS